MHRFIDHLARVFAILGGIVLSALIVMTCLSILGRSLNSILHSNFVQSWVPEFASALINAGVGPISGDFELVEAGIAFTIFAFLPLCQLNGSHASVDILTSRFSNRLNQYLLLVIETVFAAVLILIAVKLFEGMESKRNSGQTTLLLQYPVWWGYAAGVPGAIAAALVSVHVALCQLVEILSGKNSIPSKSGAGH